MESHKPMLGQTLLAVMVMLLVVTSASCSRRPIAMPVLPPVSERTPPPSRALGWEGVVVERLATEFFTTGNCAGQFTRLEGLTVEEFLHSLGVELVEPTEDSDATLIVDLTCEAESASYTPVGGPLLPTTCYAGFRVNGDVVFTDDGYDPLGFSFDINSPAPDHISTDQCVEDPDHIARLWLFDVTVTDPGDRIRRDIAAFWGEFWGPNVFVWFLNDQLGGSLERAASPEEIQIAFDLLADMGPSGKDAVPTLIAILDNQQLTSYLRSRAQGALKAITGQDFGDDARRWQRWWDKQQ
jgi:hypothetical protein